MTKAAKVQKVIGESRLADSKGQADTLRVWESYRDQALLWRSLALLQIPTTLASVVFAIVLWTTRSITLNVPLRPAPGIYQAQEITDIQFTEFATDFVNLIASYQPSVARRQFLEARNMVMEPMLTIFNNEMVNTELKAIESTQRTQLFFVDPSKTKVTRDETGVTVSMTGDRMKIVAGRELPMTTSRYEIKMRTIPRNKFNTFGMAVMNVTFENVGR